MTTQGNNNLIGTCFLKSSNVWKNQTLEWMQTFENKLTTKKHGIQKKWIEYKTFELKYGNAKLTNVCKYK